MNSSFLCYLVVYSYLAIYGIWLSVFFKNRSLRGTRLIEKLISSHLLNLLIDLTMKYHPINPNLFIKNRKNFTAKMKPSSLAVFNSNDVFTTGADSTLPFSQNRDIFYLSGADQEHTILVLFPECPNPAHREVLL